MRSMTNPWSKKCSGERHTNRSSVKKKIPYLKWKKKKERWKGKSKHEPYKLAIENVGKTWKTYIIRAWCKGNNRGNTK